MNNEQSAFEWRKNTYHSAWILKQVKYFQNEAHFFAIYAHSSNVQLKNACHTIKEALQ